MRLLAGAFTLLALAGCAAPAAEPLGAERDVARTAAAEGKQTPVLTCTSPEGFRVEHPASWSVNPGDVLPACSWFDPEPFVVPEQTDVRPALTLAVVADHDPERNYPDEVSRIVVQVDGRDALRVEQVTRAGLYPTGTPITSYALALGAGRTLLAEVVGLRGSDHAQQVAVLDAMMASLDVEDTQRA